jgi:transcriptional regulator with XRE-family HTH domain
MSRPKTRFSQNYLQFLKLLRRARIDAGLTQTDTAQRLRRPQSFVAKCESGERRVDIIELTAFCRAYHVQPEKFVRELAKRLK